MLPKPSLNRRAQAAVRELRTEHGIEPTFEEILWLHELGKRVENPAGENLERVGIPAKAGNVFLWPMTIMAGTWFNTRAMVWFSSSATLSHYSLAFALAHGRGAPLPELAPRGWLERTVRELCEIRTTHTLDDLVDRDEAYRCVKQWSARLACRPDELDAAMDYVLDAPAAEEPKQGDETTAPGIDLEDVARDLAALTGMDVDYWRKKTARDVTVRAYLQAIALEQARQGHKAPIKDAIAEAIAQERKAIGIIIKAHQEDTEE